jgi:hypothetical protein
VGHAWSAGGEPRSAEVKNPLVFREKDGQEVPVSSKHHIASYGRTSLSGKSEKWASHRSAEQGPRIGPGGCGMLIHERRSSPSVSLPRHIGKIEPRKKDRGIGQYTGGRQPRPQPIRGGDRKGNESRFRSRPRMQRSVKAEEKKDIFRTSCGERAERM